MLESVISVLVAYVLGSFPTAYLYGRIVRGIDIRDKGSGNVGALNAYRELGRLGGGLVLIVDIGKGVLVVYVTRWLGAPDAALFLAAVLAVAGHNWPVTLGFRGGRGAAVALGVSFAVLPIIAAIAFLSVLILIPLSRNPVLAITTGFLVMNSLTIATFQGASLIGMCLAMSVLVAFTYILRMGQRLLPAFKRRAWRELIRIE